jgi:hypothetical protein
MQHYLRSQLRYVLANKTAKTVLSLLFLLSIVSVVVFWKERNTVHMSWDREHEESISIADQG